MSRRLSEIVTPAVLEAPDSAEIQASEKGSDLLRSPRAALLRRQDAIVESLGDRTPRLAFASQGLDDQAQRSANERAPTSGCGEPCVRLPRWRARSAHGA
jgi:hypothetical protein